MEPRPAGWQRPIDSAPSRLVGDDTLEIKNGKRLKQPSSSPREERRARGEDHGWGSDACAAADPYSDGTTSRVHAGSTWWWASGSLLLLLHGRNCGMPCNQQQDMGKADVGKQYRSVDRLSKHALGRGHRFARASRGGSMRVTQKLALHTSQHLAFCQIDASEACPCNGTFSAIDGGVSGSLG